MVVALIPARSGSKRVPDKNIRYLGGKPLIAWAIEKAFASKCFNRVIVSSDSEQYLDIASQYGPVHCIKRPEEISGDSATDQEWIDHSLLAIGSCDYAILRPTNPFRTVAFIRQAVKLFEDYPEAREVRAIRAATEHPFKMWVVIGGEIAPLFPTTAYLYPTGSLYPVFVQGAGIEVRRQNSRGPIIPIFANEVEGLDIDSELQWKFCESLVDLIPLETEAFLGN